MGNTLGGERDIDDYPDFGNNHSSQYDNYKERNRYGAVTVTCSITGNMIINNFTKQ